VANYQEKAALLGAGGITSPPLIGYVFQSANFSGTATLPGPYYGIQAKALFLLGGAGAWTIPQGGGKQHVISQLFSGIASLLPVERQRCAASAAYSGDDGGLAGANAATVAASAANVGSGAVAAADVAGLAAAAIFSGVSAGVSGNTATMPASAAFSGVGGAGAVNTVPTTSNASAFGGASGLATANTATLANALAAFSGASALVAVNPSSSTTTAFAGAAAVALVTTVALAPAVASLSGTAVMAAVNVLPLAASSAFSGAFSTAAGNTGTLAGPAAVFSGAGALADLELVIHAGANQWQEKAALAGAGTLFGPYYGIVAKSLLLFGGQGGVGGPLVGPWRDQPAFSGAGGLAGLPSGGFQFVYQAFAGAGGLVPANASAPSLGSAAYSGASTLASGNTAVPGGTNASAFSGAGAAIAPDYDIYNFTPTLFGGAVSYVAAETVIHHFGNIYNDAPVFSGAGAVASAATAALQNTSTFSGVATLLPTERARLPAAALASANTAPAAPAAAAFSAVGAAASANSTWAAAAGGLAGSSILAATSTQVANSVAAFSAVTTLSVAPGQWLATAGAFSGIGTLPVSERIGGVQFEKAGFAGTAAWFIPAGAGTQHAFQAFSGTAALAPANVSAIAPRITFAGVGALQPSGAAALPGGTALAAAASWAAPPDYALGLAGAFSGTAALAVAYPRQLAVSQGAFASIATLLAANKATIARAAASLTAAGLGSFQFNPWAYPLSAGFSGAAAVRAAPIQAAATYSALGATAQVAASTIQLQATAAAHAGAGALASGNAGALALGAALAGRTLVTAYSNLAIASAAACFTMQPEWALREGYIAVPHDNRGGWVAGGLFAAAAI
jgi:hypothetical protein